MARGLKFRIKEVEGLYYPCSKSKGAVQLRGYRTVDLRLCLRICKKRFSHNEVQIIMNHMYMELNFNFSFKYDRIVTVLRVCRYKSCFLNVQSVNNCFSL